MHGSDGTAAADLCFDDGVLQIVSVPGSGDLRMRLVGELDVANVAAAERALRAMVETGTPLVLDVSDLSYCDSQGIRLAFALAHSALQHGGSLTLANPRGIVRRVFDVTNVASGIDIIED
jgi:anti-sigma B factor antagonist